MNDLKPCSCGGSAKIEPVYMLDFKLPYYEVWCKGCRKNIWGYSKRGVIDSWNELNLLV